MKGPLISSKLSGFTLALCLMFSGCMGGHDTPNTSPAAANTAQHSGTPYPVRVQVPAALGTVDSGLKDIQGKSIGIPCSSCHESHAQKPWAKNVDELKDFHQNLRFKHGEQSCFSCHAPEDRSKLRLADGRLLEFTDAQTLCAQCHGPQNRDWVKGSHGGMRGHWDLNAGPRERASCMSCHNAHEPSWPQVQPVFKPTDRLPLEPGSDHAL